VRAGDGNVFALTDSHWVLKLDPNAQPTDITAQFVSNSTPFDPQYNGETVWRVTNRGDGPARGIVFEFHITPSPYELYDHADIFGGTPTLLPYLQPGASDTVVVDTYTTGATTESAMVSHNEPDTDSSNNGAS